MPKRPEAIDQRLVRALAHPTRVKILETLTERVASPNWLSEHLQADLSHVAYHTRTLDRCGCLELVDTARRRGATEHFYKASPGSFVGDRAWRRVPRSLRAGISAAWIQTFMDKLIAALEAGTLDARDDTVLTWMPVRLDQGGWEDVTAILEEATDRILTAQARSRQRLDQTEQGREGTSAVVAVANFETSGSVGR
jgi:DNA-binding transcriptional ArsR family regulator